MIAGLAAVAVAIALLVAALERRSGRSTELAFRRHLVAELGAARIRTAQVELMLDEQRSHALDLSSPQDRDGHLVISAPSMRPPGAAQARGEAFGASLELSIDALPEVLRAELRAIEGDDVQREYLETIQRELAGGADAAELAARLFDPE